MGVMPPQYNRPKLRTLIPGSDLSTFIVTCSSSFLGSQQHEVYGSLMQRATMFEPGITPHPTLPHQGGIKGDGLTLSSYGQLFTRHFTSISASSAVASAVFVEDP
jgi:hypothetical protein